MSPSAYNSTFKTNTTFYAKNKKLPQIPLKACPFYKVFVNFFLQLYEQHLNRSKLTDHG